MLTAGDFDLVLQTAGQEGPQYAHHQFPVLAGSCVKVRFRFQTDEFPSYYGTKFNDYYSVTSSTSRLQVLLRLLLKQRA